MMGLVVFSFLLVVIVGVVALVVYCLYLNTVQNALRSVTPTARKMQPGEVWLMLIPLFNLVYAFIFVRRIADSFEADLRGRGQAVTGKPTYAIGLAMSIFQLFYVLPVRLHIAVIAGVVCWIMHWVQVAEMGRKLRALPTMSGDGSQIFSFPDGGYWK